MRQCSAASFWHDLSAADGFSRPAQHRYFFSLLFLCVFLTVTGRGFIQRLHLLTYKVQVWVQKYKRPLLQEQNLTCVLSLKKPTFIEIWGIFSYCVFVFSLFAERRGSCFGPVPSCTPAEPDGVLGGDDRGSLLLRRERDRLHAGRRAHPCLSSKEREEAQKRSHLFPRWRMGARQRTWVSILKLWKLQKILVALEYLLQKWDSLTSNTLQYCSLLKYELKFPGNG